MGSCTVKRVICDAHQWQSAMLFCNHIVILPICPISVNLEDILIYKHFFTFLMFFVLQNM